MLVYGKIRLLSEIEQFVRHEFSAVGILFNLSSVLTIKQLQIICRVIICVYSGNTALKLGNLKHYCLVFNLVATLSSGASNRFLPVWASCCIDSGSTGNRPLKLFICISNFLIWRDLVVCTRRNMLGTRKVHWARICSWRLDSDDKCLIFRSCLFISKSSMFALCYNQDKKQRYYIVSALADTKVDLKGIYDFFHRFSTCFS